MRLGWSPHSTGTSNAVVSYLTAPTIATDIGGTRVPIVRDPAPETLHGNPHLVGAFIDALHTKHTYACATMSFAPDDIDLKQWVAKHPVLRKQIATAIDLFADAAFAGIDAAARPPIFANTHTHTGRLEVNILMPRAVVRRQNGIWIPRGYNPNPPFGLQRKIWDHYQNALNHLHGWGDPRDPFRASSVTGPDWIMKAAAALERQFPDNADDTVPAPVRIMAAARRLSRTNASHRTALLQGLAPTLAALNWQVDHLRPDSIALRDRKKPDARPLILRGTLCAETPPTPSPHDATLRRQVLACAPDALATAILDCARQNRTTLTRLHVQIPKRNGVDPRHKMNRAQPLTLSQRLTSITKKIKDRLFTIILTVQRRSHLTAWCMQNDLSGTRSMIADTLQTLTTPANDNAPKDPTP